MEDRRILSTTRGTIEEVELSFIVHDPRGIIPWTNE